MEIYQGDFCLFSNQIHRFHRRTRNKTTARLTLWLCTCTNTNCQHTKTPAPLELVTQLPQTGAQICHFKTRKPYTVTGLQAHNGQILIEVQDSEKKLAIFQLNHVDLLPEVGDRVLVAAKPYCEWVRAKAKALRGHDPYPTIAHRQLIESLDDLGWMSSVFEVRAIKEEVAVLAGDGQRREISVECLRVLQKRQQQIQERRAAA